MANNNSWNSVIPIPLSKGGTNATSMATSTGIVKYDGTRLVTSSTDLINSSNINTNTSQPSFFSYLGSTASNVTGDGTLYQIIFNTSIFDQNSNYDTGTGVFTAPVSGVYHFSVGISLTGLVSVSTLGIIFTSTTKNYRFSNNSQSFVGNNIICSSWTIFMNATDTLTVSTNSGGSTKTVSVFGASGVTETFFSGSLVC